MTIERAIIETAHETHVAADLRARLLTLVCGDLDARVGLFVAREGDREVRTLHGIPADHAATLDASWPAVRGEVLPVSERALREGAATDREVLGARLTRTRLFRDVMAPVGGTETLFVVPRLGASPLGVLALGRCGGTFSSAARDRARGLVPILSVVCRAVAPAPAPGPALRLTAAEVDLLDYLELGWGTREIAHARGTSFFTVRNQLSALYRRLEVSNRAEAIGLRRGRQGP